MPYRLDPDIAGRVIEHSADGMALRSLLRALPIMVSDSEHRVMSERMQDFFRHVPSEHAEMPLNAQRLARQESAFQRNLERGVAVLDESSWLRPPRLRPARRSSDEADFVFDEEAVPRVSRQDAQPSVPGGPRSNTGDIEPEDL